MKTTAIVYKSTYGYAKRYAEWLVEALAAVNQEATLLDAAKTDVKKLLEFDTIVYFGGLYASSVNGFSQLRAHHEKLKNKNLVLCSVGLTPPDDAEQIQAVQQKALGSELAHVPAFHLPGGLDVKRLGFLHKNMLKLIFSQLNKQAELTPLETNILACQNSAVDHSRREALAPVLSYLQADLQNH